MVLQNKSNKGGNDTEPADDEQDPKTKKFIVFVWSRHFSDIDVLKTMQDSQRQAFHKSLHKLNGMQDIAKKYHTKQILVEVTKEK